LSAASFAASDHFFDPFDAESATDPYDLACAVLFFTIAVVHFVCLSIICCVFASTAFVTLFPRDSNPSSILPPAF
jgi:hypothetical protein